MSCPDLPNGWSQWSVWQYSDSGSVSGISGAVDLDEYNGTLADLQTFAGGSAGPCGDLACWGQRHRHAVVDVNGDGKADVCARAKAGISCWLSNGSAFPTTVTGPTLSDSEGWTAPQYDSTIQFADVDGDGKSDVCARAAAGVRCWLSTGSGFSTQIGTSEFSDSSGWAKEQYYGTIQMADVDGDGKADVCGRGASGFICLLSDGTGFTTQLSLGDMADSGGWNDPKYYTTIQMGDVNGDGKADVCARAKAGVSCWLSEGNGFSKPVTGPGLSDSEGWSDPKYYTTIQLGDVNGDGKADVCARAAAGFRCWLSNGSGFPTEISTTEFSDSSGWGDAKYYGTIQLADVDGDGKEDVCARAAAGFMCLFSTGTGFGAKVSTTEYSDSSGWGTPDYYTTLQTGDVDGDGKADVCARGSAGVTCRLSSGSGFGTGVTGPGLSNAEGWDSAQYYETFALVGSLGKKPASAGDAGGGGSVGDWDAGRKVDAAARASASRDASTAKKSPSDASDDATPEATAGNNSGCSCRTAQDAETDASPLSALVGAVALLGCSRLRCKTRRPVRSRVGSARWVPARPLARGGLIRANRSHAAASPCVMALLGLGALVSACSSPPPAREHVASSAEAITPSTIVSRADQWVTAKLQYCQSPNHKPDPDPSCSSTCERTDNPEWDPYRSDCSGFVSWSWGLSPPGLDTSEFAPADTSVSSTIKGSDLQPGDALNIPGEHIILFVSWKTTGSVANFYEEPGCSVSTPYAHAFTSSVTINGSSVTVAYEGKTFTAIRYKDVTEAATGPCGDLACWGQRHRHAVVDVNGDGKADVCARAKAGISCWLSNGSAFPTTVTGPTLSDSEGWTAPQYDSTIQFADVDGDGKSDVCARAAAGVRCWLSTGSGFSTQIGTSEFSDSSGWAKEQYYGTIQMADVDGDGKADVCGRGASGFICLLSDGTGFTTQLSLGDMADSGGWNDPKYYTTIQMGDVNGDGKADVCARAKAGVSCWLSEGNGFSKPVTGPGLSDSEGWSDPKYYTTIQLGDVNGDGKADVCARAAAGFRCWLSNGSGFPTEISTTEFSDSSGWGDAKYYGTIQLADVDGDGKEDVCARAAAGFMCLFSTGTGFGAKVSTTEYSDSSGWGTPDYYTTLQTGDVDGDGKADVCARGSAGVTCRLSSGSGFGTGVTGPGLSNAEGWDSAQYYETFALVGSLGKKPASAGDAGGGGADGGGADGGGADGGGSVGDRDAGRKVDAAARASASRDASTAKKSPSDASDDATPEATAGNNSGCSCRTAQDAETDASPLSALVGAVALLGCSRLRRKTRAMS